tara:strand:- start:2695 stop:5586 length:2892 start_codon:yes stop_codon:yes gene_type:complete
MDKTVSALLGKLSTELQDCLRLAEDTPLVNPYQQLSYRLLNAMKQGDVEGKALNEVIDELTLKAFLNRAERARAYLKETDRRKNRIRMRQSLERLVWDETGGKRPFDRFQAQLESDVAGIVITAHPTFGFSAAQYDILADLVDRRINKDEAGRKLKVASARPDEGLSLDYEFTEAEQALIQLQEAIAELYDIALEVAAEHYPDDWTQLTPRLTTAASWVGFDVDGRDDITWLKSVAFRYDMALRQVTRYLDHWDRISTKTGSQESRAEDPVRAALTIVYEILQEDRASLPDRPSEVVQVREFSRQVVRNRKEKGRVQDLMRDILDHLADHIAREGDQSLLRRLLVYRALFANFGIGLSHIHFRLNAVQLHNAIRPLVALEKDPDDASNRRRYMKAATRVLDHMTPVTAGYENILHEQTTAKRLFMIVAQFLKYIDPETPIRFLIAESDTPFTVLAALCYAKMFGVEDRVDISPLFETDEALERGARIIEELLENEHYYAYVKKRGRLCVQAGYSDAGRYLGQVAAGLGIERLRIKLACLWKKFDLDDVQLVIFDTGGESLGRGAHPDGFEGRLEYKHPLEARRLIRRLGISYKQEFSLQGGDGYLWLRRENLAFATLTRVMENLLASPVEENDRLYEDTDWSLDFFLTVKEYNTRLSGDPDYIKLLSLLGPEVSYPSGSRMTLRQDEGVLSRGLEKLSQIRAIPNNMLLHQLGYLANSIGGIGTALAQDGDAFWKTYDRSSRLRHIMKLVLAAADLTDEDVLGAYMALFRPRYWMHCARFEKDSSMHLRMLRLAKMLEKHGVYEGLNRIELKLREDLIFLKDKLKERKADKGEIHRAGLRLIGEDRTFYILLHVLRLALIQKIFLLVTRIPRFRDHKGVTVDDLVMQILRFQIPPALNMLREIFPMEAQYDIDPDNPEKITFRGDDAHGYEYENRVIFDEISSTYDQIRKISLAITAYVGAVG